MTRLTKTFRLLLRAGALAALLVAPMMLVSAVNAGTELDDRRPDAGQEGPRPGASGQSAARLTTKTGSLARSGPAPSQLSYQVSIMGHGKPNLSQTHRDDRHAAALSAPELHRSG